MNLKNTIISFILIPLSLFSFRVCAQNLKADGYRGLWSSSLLTKEYGYKFSGGLGTSSSQHIPVSIYSPEARKTFFVYGGTTIKEKSHLQIMISYFDHRTRMVPRPVIIYDKMGVDDPQDNASISLDPDGYIWVFISGMGRTRPGLIFKSSEPFSINKFDRIMEGEILSPQPWLIKDSCFLVMYTRVSGKRDLYWTSFTILEPWTPGHKLTELGGCYQVSNVYGNKLVSIFSYAPEDNMDKRTNLYLLQTDDLGKTWKTVDNKVVKTPLSDINNEALVMDYEAEKKLVYIKDLNFDSDGNPVILTIISRDFRPGQTGDPREWMIINWKNNKWNFNKVCESLHNYDMGSLYIKGNIWRIIGPTEAGPQKYGAGGEMALWESSDEGSSWKKVNDITGNSTRNNSYARRPVNANKGFYSFWADGDADKLSESKIFFTDESCKKVWVLPYDMKNDFERPLRIK